MIIFIVCCCRHKKRSSQGPSKQIVDEVVDLAGNEKFGTCEPPLPYYPYANPGFPTVYAPVLEENNPSIIPYYSPGDHHEIILYPPYCNSDNIPVDSSKNLAKGVDEKAAAINSSNFMEVTMQVSLDKDSAYNGQNNCKICSKGFFENSDARILPCSHCFHRKCIYSYFVEDNKENCPICQRYYN